ncbi:MAG: NAD-dependent malic enzyme [Chloroflexi bacterium]|nr:NAD-dependent malic enzyme [Chloroflexota bacterium]
MSLQEEALVLHREKRGKIYVGSKVAVNNAHDLSVAYTPGVAEPCKEIARDPELLDIYTSRWNMVAVVSDGSAVLGLGNIGGRAAMPVMEGKSVLFKAFAGVDAFPICLDTQDPDEIIRTVQVLEPTFGGINLEDIAAPNCFYVESELKKKTKMPIFHDDQHGTAVVVSSGLFNALKLTGRKMSDLNVVVNGAGAAAVAITKLLLSMGVGSAVLCDRKGIIYRGRGDLNPSKEEIANLTNRDNEKGALADAMRGKNVFIGVSSAKVVSAEMIATMAKNPIVFAMANPVPEILPEEAKAGGARIVATGRSDFPNQVNNVLGFPGIFRGALDVRATDINEEMKIAAARALADLVAPEELTEDYFIPRAFDLRIAPAVASAVAEAAAASGVARKPMTGAEVAEHTRQLLKNQRSEE